MFDRLEVHTEDGWRQRGMTLTAVTGLWSQIWSLGTRTRPHLLAMTYDGCDVAVPARASPLSHYDMTYLSLSHSLTAVSILTCPKRIAGKLGPWALCFMREPKGI